MGCTNVFSDVLSSLSSLGDQINGVYVFTSYLLRDLKCLDTVVSLLEKSPVFSISDLNFSLVVVDVVRGDLLPNSSMHPLFPSFVSLSLRSFARRFIHSLIHLL